ncbi:hypothetical protein KAW96_04900 [candidate division WOR-3 bacterium]|nr:hypothetical protein [candidate division WOR-3 bacterium]
MKITKDRVIILIDKKISQFEQILSESTFNNRFDENYDLAYYGTEALLTDLFNKEEAKKFRRNVSSPIFIIGGEADYSEELKDFREHLEHCIAQLKVYRERVLNFWEEDEMKRDKEPENTPFVSMSFDEQDKDINEYITGILNALEIKFQTGERYSRDSIPEKVRKRIHNCAIFIAIFVKRDKIKGGYTAPSWLFKELGTAQGLNREVIAWVEKGIKDIAGLNYEKEVIYFDRADLQEIKKATIKFLEALKEHKLIS